MYIRNTGLIQIPVFIGRTSANYLGRFVESLLNLVPALLAIIVLDKMCCLALIECVDF